MCQALGHAEKNIFFDVDIVVKKKIECGLALSGLLSTTICVITVVKICCLLTWPRLESSPHAGESIIECGVFTSALRRIKRYSVPTMPERFENATVIGHFG